MAKALGVSEDEVIADMGNFDDLFNDSVQANVEVTVKAEGYADLMGAVIEKNHKNANQLLSEERAAAAMGEAEAILMELFPDAKLNKDIIGRGTFYKHPEVESIVMFLNQQGNDIDAKKVSLQALKKAKKWLKKQNISEDQLAKFHQRFCDNFSLNWEFTL